MFCKFCGKELSENAFVCPNCGALTENKQPKPKLDSSSEVHFFDIMCIVNFGLMLLIGFLTFGASIDSNVWFHISTSSGSIRVFPIINIILGAMFMCFSISLSIKFHLKINSRHIKILNIVSMSVALALFLALGISSTFM